MSSFDFSLFNKLKPKVNNWDIYDDLEESKVLSSQIVMQPIIISCTNIVIASAKRQQLGSQC